jgi:co-chaperonin GroES (HSP10)
MLKPLQDKILVELEESLNTNIPGFLLKPTPDKWQGRDGSILGEMRGKVVAVGPGRRLELTGEFLPMCVQPGDVVRLSELEYHTEKENGKTYVLASEADVLWVEEAEAA